MIPITSLPPNWAIPVPLMPDELLSSWLVRVALANGCDPLVLSASIWGKWRAWTRDIDRNPGEERLMLLSKFSGVDCDDLKQSILFPVASTILGKEARQKELWPWLLTVGARNRSRNGGIQYCAECLKEDTKPYFRREWRYAWHIGCLKHGKPLLDRCPHCHAPLEPHRLEAEDQTLTQCASCHLNLLDTVSPEIINIDAMAFQVWVDEILTRQKNTIVHGIPVSIFAWFDAARYYESLVRRCLIAQHSALENFADSVNIKLGQDEFRDVALIEFEQMNIVARATMLASINKLMSLSQDELLQKLSDSGVTKQGFCSGRKRIPDNLKGIAASLPDAKRAPKKPVIKKVTTTGLPKPRSKWEVERMWKRLLQKMKNDPGYGR